MDPWIITVCDHSGSTQEAPSARVLVDRDAFPNQEDAIKEGLRRLGVNAIVHPNVWVEAHGVPVEPPVEPPPLRRRSP